VQPVVHRTRQFLVECFLPGVDRRDVEAAASRARSTTRDLRADGQAIEYLGAILLPSDEVVLHLFRASSPEEVRVASERAQVVFERVTDALVVDGFDVLEPVPAGPREDTSP
jgi:hypothetical protein